MEHNHTEWSDEALQEKLGRLRAVDQPWQNEERLGQVRQELNVVAFEISERYRQSKKIRVEDAYEAVQEVYRSRDNE